MNMIERFIALIHEYQAKQKEIISLFQKYKEIDNPAYWRMIGLPKDDFIDSEQTIKYYFHGIGCRVTYPSGEIDWDFGHEATIEGFGLWFLWKFAVDGTSNFPEFKDKKVYDEICDEVLEQGLIHQPYKDLHDYLYYFQNKND